MSRRTDLAWLLMRRCFLLMWPLSLTVLAVFGLEIYGWGIFVFLPVGLGYAAVALLPEPAPSLGKCVGAALTWLLVGMFALLLFAMEGLACIIMALPLEVPLTALGGILGWMVFSGSVDRQQRTYSVLLLSLVLPLSIGAEAGFRAPPPVYCVTSHVIVAAPPEVVWRHVVTFSEIPKPQGDWLFVSAAYPVRARIEGSGVGAMRYCEFNTGPFVEPITAWDEPRHLAFDVTANPPPMRELSLYQKVHAPHLEGHFISRRGEFRLTALEDGQTLLEGTTWYEHDIAPAWYWQKWSDYIIHRIHLRVLQHVKSLAESKALAPSPRK